MCYIHVCKLPILFVFSDKWARARVKEILQKKGAICAQCPNVTGQSLVATLSGKTCYMC